MDIMGLVGDVANMLGLAGGLVAGAKALADWHTNRQMVNIELALETPDGVVRWKVATLPAPQVTRSEVLGRLTMKLTTRDRMVVAWLASDEGMAAIDRMTGRGGVLTIPLKAGRKNSSGFDHYTLLVVQGRPAGGGKHKTPPDTATVIDRAATPHCTFPTLWVVGRAHRADAAMTCATSAGNSNPCRVTDGMYGSCSPNQPAAQHPAGKSALPRRDTMAANIRIVTPAPKAGAENPYLITFYLGGRALTARPRFDDFSEGHVGFHAPLVKLTLAEQAAFDAAWERHCAASRENTHEKATTTLLLWVAEVGAHGAELHTEEATTSPPRDCPGLGGWKRGSDGKWWTRVKGTPATLFKGRGGRYVTVGLKGETILSVTD